LTTSVGRATVTPTPPTGELAVGAARLPEKDAAVCVIVKLVPATVSVAVRAAPVFVATEKVTVPFPLPDDPVEIVTNVALLAAVHVQPVPAVTATDPVPPAAPNAEAEIPPTVTVQDGVLGGVVLLLFLEHAAPSTINAATVTKR